MSVKGPTADQVNAATRLHTPRADIAFQAKVDTLSAKNFGGKVAALFFRIVHFFGYYGDVSGAKTLKAERVAIRQMDAAQANLVTKYVVAAVTDKNPEQTAAFVADAQKAFYSALTGRIVMLTGDDLSKPGVIDGQANLYNAGFERLGQVINGHNQCCTAVNNRDMAKKFITVTTDTIKGQIASNVRKDLAKNITPAVIKERGLPFLDQLAQQQIKVFGSKTPAAELVAELHKEVIAQNGALFDKQVKIERSPANREAAVIAKTAQIKAERDTATHAIETLSQQCQVVLQQIEADEAALKGAENIVASRQELFAMARNKAGKIPNVGIVLSENPVKLLKTPFHTGGIDEKGMVILRNVKATAQALIAARKQVDLIQNRMAVRLTQVDTLTQGIAKAQETVRQTPRLLNNVEFLVNKEIADRAKVFGYLASSGTIGDKRFLDLVYPKAPAKVEPKKVNVADVLKEKANILKKAELLIKKEKVVNNDLEGVEFAVLSSTGQTKKEAYYEAGLDLGRLADELAEVSAEQTKQEAYHEAGLDLGRLSDDLVEVSAEQTNKEAYHEAGLDLGRLADGLKEVSAEDVYREAGLDLGRLSDNLTGTSKANTSNLSAADFASEQEIQDLLAINMASEQDAEEEEIQWRPFQRYEAPKAELTPSQTPFDEIKPVAAAPKAASTPHASILDLFDDEGNPFVDEKPDAFAHLPRPQDAWVY